MPYDIERDAAQDRGGAEERFNRSLEQAIDHEREGSGDQSGRQERIEGGLIEVWDGGRIAVKVKDG